MGRKKYTQYDQIYYFDKYVMRFGARIGLAHLYYLWLAFFCLILPAKLKRGDRVLDVGCGIGYLVWALRKFGILAFGIDKSESAQIYCLEPKYCQFGIKNKLPFEKSTFDLVCSNEVLEHVAFRDLLILMKETQRVSKNKQIHMIGVSDRGDISVNEPTHVTAETEKWWRKKFQQWGFKVRVGNLFYFFPYLYSKGSVWNGAKKGYFFLEHKF